MNEAAQRAAVVEEARSWLGTPYHHMAGIKGAGVDCAQILIEVYHAALGISKPDVGYYPIDWMMHRDEERYLGWLREYATETDNPQAGDVLIWKYGRVFSHAGIVVDYPTMIHSFRRAGMVILDDATLFEFANRERKAFTFWGHK